MIHPTRIGLVLAVTVTLTMACTPRDLHRECQQHDECPEGQVCQFDVCVDEGSVQDNVCREGFAFCDGECTDTQTQLAACGGCDGCPEVENADAVSCTQGVCQYTCSGDWRDRDDNPANGCDCPAGTDCDCIPDGPELCDLRDNDCDGTVDNVLLTEEDAEWRAHCPDYPNGEPTGCESGFCTYRCADGYVDRRDPTDGCECEVSMETCNGQDDDCDGSVDFSEATATPAPCPEVRGARGRCLVTECEYTCDDGVDVDGDLGLGTEGTGCECQPSGPEVCDLVDNDCDGLVDEEDDSLTTALCESQLGVCAGARRQCDQGVELPCSRERLESEADRQGREYEAFEGTCDLTDNDCNGTEDDHCCTSASFGMAAWGAPRSGESSISIAGAVAGDTIAHVASSNSGVWARGFTPHLDPIGEPVHVGEGDRVFAAVRPDGEFQIGFLDDTQRLVQHRWTPGQGPEAQATTLLPFQASGGLHTKVPSWVVGNSLVVALASPAGVHVLAIAAETGDIMSAADLPIGPSLVVTAHI